MELQATYKNRKRFTVRLNGTYAKIVMEWHKLPKYNGIQVSQLIYATS